MPVAIKVPSVGESIQEVEIHKWLKREGDRVEADENLVEIESDKATVEVPAPRSGVLTKILKVNGDVVPIGETIGFVEEGAGTPAATSAPSAAPAAAAKPAPAPASAPQASSGPARVMPAAERALAERGLTADKVAATGPGGRLLKEDVEKTAAQAPAAALVPPPEVVPASTTPAPTAVAPSAPVVAGPMEEVVPMSMIRRRIAERLVQAQQTAALLTTFNEVDLSAVKELRARYKDAFQAKYGAKLGFMSFFVKATVDALKEYPELNAEIRGNQVVYRNYYNIGIAVGGGKGLVVPVLRNAERMSFAEVEQGIESLGKKAKDNQITPQDLQGGTFTLTNGGIYGSLFSTPIVNPPQSGILGMHAIQDRPMAVNGQVVIRPMMYLALTYDHRLVDGREAVQFLKRICDAIQEPARMLMEV